MANPTVLSVLATAFGEGGTTVDGVVKSASHTLGRNWRWLRPLSRRYIAAFGGQTRPRQREVMNFLLNDSGFSAAWSRHYEELDVAR